MPSDWIKSRDNAFQEQAKELIDIIAEYKEKWGLTAEDLVPLTQSQSSFDEALVEQSVKASAYHAIVARKQANREELERALRAMVRRINNHPGMTEELRQQMNLASPTGRPTRHLSRKKTCETIDS